MRVERSRRGISLLEVLAVVAILGVLAAVVTPLAGKAIRRARALSAISNLNRVLTQARLNAVKRGFQVVVQVSKSTTGRVRLFAWEDRNPDYTFGTYTPTGGGGSLPEVVLQDFESEGTIHLWKHGGTIDDPTTAVMFNTYQGDASRTALVVFLPNGSLLPPEAVGCGVPKPSSPEDGRGIYIADESGKNFFRLTFYSNYVAKVRVEKWIDATAGYSATNWVWL